MVLKIPSCVPSNSDFPKKLGTNYKIKTVTPHGEGKTQTLLLSRVKYNRSSRQPLQLPNTSHTDKIGFLKMCCEACSSTDLEAIKVRVGHCQNRPVKRLLGLFTPAKGDLDAWHDYFLCFFTPQLFFCSSRWTEVISKIRSDAPWDTAKKIHLQSSFSLTLKTDLKTE